MLADTLMSGRIHPAHVPSLFKETSMQPQKELITETALLEIANKIIREHEDFIHGMRADAVQQRGDILVFKGEFFLAEDGTPTGKTMAVFNMFKLLAQQLSGQYRLE